MVYNLDKMLTAKSDDAAANPIWFPLGQTFAVSW